MLPLCRHILPSGVICNQAAIKDTYFCRHHGQIKKVLARPPRNPNDFTFRLAFDFPEDHAAIQINLFLVLQALNDHKIDNPTANTMNRLLRSCELNLEKMPQTEAAAKNSVQRVILTPEGEEIAPPREQLEEGEAEPLHHKDCPCQRCAEQFRNAAPEQHHQNCQCGLCEDSPSRHTRFAQDQDTDSSSSPERIAVGEPAVKTAPAEKLYSKQLTIDPANKEVSLYDYLYGDKHKQYEAQYAARARAALEAGIEPPPYEPFDPKKIESEGMRRYKATMEEVEKNKQIAEEIWQRRFGNEDPQLPKATELNP